MTTLFTSQEMTTCVGLSSDATHSIRKFVLVLGFLGLAGGVFAAWQTPATGYEVSIYASTPVTYWGGIGAAFVAAAVVCAVSLRDSYAGLALALGGLGTVSIVGLPLVRGYHFHGQADALTHLGWAREMALGERAATELFYPGAHSISVLFSKTLGVPLPQAMMLTVTVLTGVFVLFVPLTALVLTDARGPAAVAAFSGFMLLPFNQISTHLLFHTYSLGVLFLPVVLYLLLVYISRDVEAEGVLRSPTADDIALLVAAAALLLFHGQVTLNFIIIVGSIVAFRKVIRYRRPSSLIGELRPLYGQFLAISILWFAWVFQFPQPPSLLGGMIEAVQGFILGTEPAGQVVADRGQSAEQVGAGLEELFFKIFLVPAIYCLFTGTLVLMATRDSLPKISRNGQPIVMSFGFVFIVLGVFFSLHLPGRLSEYFFRHVGFGILLVTILGSVGVYYTASGVLSLDRRRVFPAAGILLVSLALLLSLLVVFPSPYILNNNAQVSDHQVSGYSTAFEYHEEGVPFSGVRAGPDRFVDGLDPEKNVATTGGLSGQQLRRNPVTVADSGLYIPVTTADYQREIVAYRSLRYSAATFDSLDRHQGLDRVQTNGEFDLYRVQAQAVSAASEGTASSLESGVEDT